MFTVSIRAPMSLKISKSKTARRFDALQKIGAAVARSRVPVALSGTVVFAICVFGVRGLLRAGESLDTRILRLSIIFIAIPLLIAFFVLNRVHRKHIALTAELIRLSFRERRLEEERTELGQLLILAQEEERSRIGRELDDCVQQRVALLASGLAQLRTGSSIRNTGFEVQRLLDQMNQLSEDLHRLSREFHSSMLDHLGLVAAARAFCDEFPAETNYRWTHK